MGIRGTSNIRIVRPNVPVVVTEPMKLIRRATNKWNFSEIEKLSPVPYQAVFTDSPGMFVLSAPAVERLKIDLSEFVYRNKNNGAHQMRSQIGERVRFDYETGDNWKLELDLESFNEKMHSITTTARLTLRLRNLNDDQVIDAGQIWVERPRPDGTSILTIPVDTADDASGSMKKQLGQFLSYVELHHGKIRLPKTM